MIWVVCSSCGALLPEENVRKHTDWHALIDGALLKVKVG